MTERRATRTVQVGDLLLGSGHPVRVQSMTNTNTEDAEATIAQIQDLLAAGCEIIRVTVNHDRAADALPQIRAACPAPLVADIHFTHRLALRAIEAGVDKVRLNPGNVGSKERVEEVVAAAKEAGIALRIGVNSGSVEKDLLDKHGWPSPDAMVESAVRHCETVEAMGFQNYLVSLKSTDLGTVLEANRKFSQINDVPLHLGVTEAGLPPDGIIKTRIALEQLIGSGIGDTIRVSLTVSNDRKGEEIAAGRNILADIAAGRVRTVVDFGLDTLNIISCPSCSRVENEAFIELAEQVKEITQYAQQHALTIAVMGCRVNGPGETDDADLGLWCGPKHVHLKRGAELVGVFSYEQILPKLKEELDQMIVVLAG